MSVEIPAQQQRPPGRESELRPTADHGEESYAGHTRLEDKDAIVTGADSGIGRAVAIAFPRAGANVVIAYLDEHDHAPETAEWIEALVGHALETFGRIDVLVTRRARRQGGPRRAGQRDALAPP